MRPNTEPNGSDEVAGATSEAMSTAAEAASAAKVPDDAPVAPFDKERFLARLVDVLDVMPDALLAEVVQRTEGIGREVLKEKARALHQRMKHRPLSASDAPMLRPILRRRVAQGPVWWPVVMCWAGGRLPALVGSPLREQLTTIKANLRLSHCVQRTDVYDAVIRAVDAPTVPPDQRPLLKLLLTDLCDPSLSDDAWRARLTTLRNVSENGSGADATSVDVDRDDTGRGPHMGMTSTDPRDDAGDAHTFETPQLRGLWSEFIERARALPPEAPEWDHAQAFAAEINAIASERLAARDRPRLELVDCLERLRAQRDALEFFELAEAVESLQVPLGLRDAPAVLAAAREFEELLALPQAKRASEVTARKQRVDGLADRLRSSLASPPSEPLSSHDDTASAASPASVAVGPVSTEQAHDAPRTIEEAPPPSMPEAATLSGPAVVAQDAPRAEAEPATTESIAELTESAEPIAEPTESAEPDLIAPRSEASEASSTELSNEAEGEALGPHAALPRPASPQWHGALTIEVAANSALASEAPVDARRAFGWALLRDDELGQAYAVACDDRDDRDAELAPLPATTIRWVALSRVLGSPDDDGALGQMEATHDLFQSDVDRLRACVGPRRRALALLAFAACARAGVIVQDGIAAQHLMQFEIGAPFGPVDELRALIGKYGLMGTTLAAMPDRRAAEDALRAVEGSARDWRERKRLKTMKLQRATWIWQRWMQPGGPLGDLLDLIRRDRIEEAEYLSQEVESWRDQGLIDRKVAEYDQRNAPNTARTDPIVGAVLNDLRREVAEVVRLVDQWLDAVRRERATTSGKDQRALQYRGELRPSLRAACACLEANAGGAVDLKAATQVALRAIERIERMFDERPPPMVATRGETASRLLEMPLVGVTDAAVVERKPRRASAAVVEAIARHVQNGRPHLQKRFTELLERNDFREAERALSFLEGELGAPELERLRRRFDEARQSRRERVERAVAQARDALERATLEGIVIQSERDEFDRKLSALSPHDDTGQARMDEAQRLHGLVEERRRERAKGARDKLSGDYPGDVRARIESALDRGDLIAAEEYIAQYEKNGSIPSQRDDADVAAEFFPSFVERWGSHLRAQGRSGLGTPEIESIKQRRLLSFDDLSEQVDRTVEELRAWISLVNRQGNRADLIQQVLEAMGFERSEASEITSHRAGPRNVEWQQVYDVDTVPMRDRERCPLHQFGSSVSGRYRVVCMWGAHSPTEIVTAAKVHGDQARATIVLYLGGDGSPSWLGLSERRRLAAACRDERARLVVVDEAVFLYVALCAISARSQHRTRLAVMFACTLPFTTAEPYTTTAGQVSPEMFYGRREATRQVLDVDGTCLVYGGRQLGKTALLRQVERSYHAPSRGVVVKVIDLRVAGVGEAVPLDGLFAVIASTLQADVPEIGKAASWSGLRDKIPAWLNADGSRRIILLLDESDRFLEGDARAEKGSYPNLMRLKDLMERTQRRFKVVFAGLHNVQRTARDPNSPLAHLGTPLCVGPLIESGEAREAYKLIVEPLRALGYRFESTDVVTRILGHTNWYPSLVQLFCQQLLAHLQSREAATEGPAQSPPYVIRAADVEKAFRNRALQKAIVDRFTWTLDLDVRYRVLALCIAHRIESDPKGARRGVSVSDVRDEALYWWESGFLRDATLEAFETLLDEMVGLGILRCVEQRYVLRSSNVVSLLGDVEKNLLDAAHRTPEPEYEPHTFRRQVNAERTWERSPLTARQESQILEPSDGVVALFGSKISDLDSVVRCLSRSVLRREISQVPFSKGQSSATSTAELKEWIQRCARSRQNQLLLVIDDASRWTPEWLRVAIEETERLKSVKNHVRVLFLGSPERAWEMVEDGRFVPELEGVSVLSLGPWDERFVDRWRDELAFGAGEREACLAALTEATGGWSDLLHRLGKEVHERGGDTWKQTLQDFRDASLDPQQILRRFDLPSRALPPLRDLAEYGEPVSAQDFVRVAVDLDRSEVNHTLTWARLVGFAADESKGWRLDPLLAKLLLSERAS